MQKIKNKMCRKCKNLQIKFAENTENSENEK